MTMLLVPCSLILAPSCSQKIEASQNPLPVGSTVTLTSNFSVSQGTWFFEKQLIVFIVGKDSVVSNVWSARTTFDSNTSSLTIRSLQTQDSGVYQLQAVNSFTAELTLNVQGKDPLQLSWLLSTKLVLGAFLIQIQIQSLK